MCVGVRVCVWGARESGRVTGREGQRSWLTTQRSQKPRGREDRATGTEQTWRRMTEGRWERRRERERERAAKRHKGRGREKKPKIVSQVMRDGAAARGSGDEDRERSERER